MLIYSNACDTYILKTACAHLVSCLLLGLSHTPNIHQLLYACMNRNKTAQMDLILKYTVGLADNTSAASY